MSQLVRCYQEVFAAPPWNEWKVCHECGSSWGIDSKPPDWHCGVEISEFWPATQVEASFAKDLSSPNTSCWIALDDGALIGFCHGYEVTGQYLEQKLSWDGLAEKVTEVFGNSRLAYQDEMALLPQYRGRGIARDLFDRRNLDFLNFGLKTGILRTMSSPPSITFLWYTRIGYQAIDAHDDSKGHVILARSLSQ